MKFECNELPADCDGTSNKDLAAGDFLETKAEQVRVSRFRVSDGWISPTILRFRSCMIFD